MLLQLISLSYGDLVASGEKLSFRRFCNLTIMSENECLIDIGSLFLNNFLRVARQSGFNTLAMFTFFSHRYVQRMVYQCSLLLFLYFTLLSIFSFIYFIFKIILTFP